MAEAIPGIRIIVKRCTFLPNMDKRGKTDGYCKFVLKGKEDKTHWIPNCLNPQWNYVHDQHGPINLDELATFRVYDHDRISKDDYIGQVDVYLRDVEFGEEKSYQLMNNGKPVTNGKKYGNHKSKIVLEFINSATLHKSSSRSTLGEDSGSYDIEEKRTVRKKRSDSGSYNLKREEKIVRRKKSGNYSPRRRTSPPRRRRTPSPRRSKQRTPRRPSRSPPRRPSPKRTRTPPPEKRRESSSSKLDDSYYSYSFTPDENKPKVGTYTTVSSSERKPTIKPKPKLTRRETPRGIPTGAPPPPPAPKRSLTSNSDTGIGQKPGALLAAIRNKDNKKNLRSVTAPRSVPVTKPKPKPEEGGDIMGSLAAAIASRRGPIEHDVEDSDW